jgi:hypothetical protein
MQNSLTSKAGYHLAAGEALRRGYKADLAKDGRRWRLTVNDAPVQVKSHRSGDWPFADPEKEVWEETAFMIFVDLAPEEGPTYYVIEKDELRSILKAMHEDFLRCQKDGGRPRNPESKQQSLKTSDLEPYRGKWDLLQS